MDHFASNQVVLQRTSIHSLAARIVLPFKWDWQTRRHKTEVIRRFSELCRILSDCVQWFKLFGEGSCWENRRQISLVIGISPGEKLQKLFCVTKCAHMSYKTNCNWRRQGHICDAKYMGTVKAVIHSVIFWSPYRKAKFKIWCKRFSMCLCFLVHMFGTGWLW